MHSTEKTILQKLKDYRKDRMIKRKLSSHERAELDDIISQVERKGKSKDHTFNETKLARTLLKQRRNEYLNLSINNDKRIRDNYLDDLEAINRINSNIGITSDWSEEHQMLKLQIIRILKNLNPNEYTDKVSRFKNRRDFSIVEDILSRMDKKIKQQVREEEIKKAIIRFFE
mgnify:CR=1 FL=1